MVSNQGRANAPVLPARDAAGGLPDAAFTLHPPTSPAVVVAAAFVLEGSAILSKPAVSLADSLVAWRWAGWCVAATVVFAAQ